jgi:transposase
VTRALLTALRALVDQIDVLTDQITEQLHAHTDAHVFTNLPRAGTVRAARLLAEIGDARGRFPTPEALASLAGVAPSTRQSGKSRIVGFRWAVDRQLRDALAEWAGDSRLSSPWAADIYRRARDRGCDHPHAVRILARAWVYVVWRCWQDGRAYDPDKHAALQRLSTGQNVDAASPGKSWGGTSTVSAAVSGPGDQWNRGWR